MTIVPLSLYLKGSWIKISIGVGKGKNYMTRTRWKKKKYEKKLIMQKDKILSRIIETINLNLLN